MASFEGRNKIYYGIENVYYADESLKGKSDVEEAFNCPCGKPLEYEKNFLHSRGIITAAAVLDVLSRNIKLMLLFIENIRSYK